MIHIFIRLISFHILRVVIFYEITFFYDLIVFQFTPNPLSATEIENPFFAHFTFFSFLCILLYITYMQTFFQTIIWLETFSSSLHSCHCVVCTLSNCEIFVTSCRLRKMLDKINKEAFLMTYEIFWIFQYWMTTTNSSAQETFINQSYMLFYAITYNCYHFISKFCEWIILLLDTIRYILILSSAIFWFWIIIITFREHIFYLKASCIQYFKSPPPRLFSLSIDTRFA